MTEQAQLQVFKKKIAIILVAALSLYAIFISLGILSKLGIAILFCVILDPLVKWFMKYMPRHNRLLAVLVTLASLSLFVLFVIAQLVPIVVTQLSGSIAELEKAAEEAQRSGQTLSQALSAMNPEASISALLPYVAQAIPGILSFITESLSSILGTIFSQLMVFGFVLFGLLEGPYWVKTVKSVLPKDRKQEIVWTAQQAYRSVTSYITGNLFISLCAGVAAMLFCLVTGMPYVLMLGLAVAICDLIPMVGAYLSGIVLGLFGLILVGPEVGIAAAIFVTIYQQFENQILSPIVYNKAVKLTPLTALVSVSIGGAVAGLLGALIAIPVGGTVQLVLQRYFSKKQTPATKKAKA